MAWNLKYYAEWYHFRQKTSGKWSRLEIYVQDDVEEPTEVLVNDLKVKQPGIDLFTTDNCLVGEGLDMTLISHSPLDFLDTFYTVDPMGVKVKYYSQYSDISDYITLDFVGYVDTEQYHDPISERLNYKMNITANNGFAVLDRLPFLDSSGDKFQGLMSINEIVYICLSKLGISYDSYNIGIYTKLHRYGKSADNSYIYGDYYAGTTYEDESIGVFDECNILAENFYDEEDNPMSCRQVLNSILLPFTAKMFIHENEVFIFDLMMLTKESKQTEMYSFGSSEFEYEDSESPRNIQPSIIRTIDERLESHSVDIIPGKKEVKLTFNKYVQENPVPIEIQGQMSSFLGQTNYEKDGETKYKEFRYADCKNFHKMDDVSNSYEFIKRTNPDNENAEYFVRFFPTDVGYWAVQINTGIWIDSSAVQFIGLSGRVLADDLDNYMEESTIHSNQNTVPLLIKVALQSSKEGVDDELVDRFYDREEDNSEYPEGSYWEHGPFLNDGGSSITASYIPLREYDGAAQYNKWYNLNGGAAYETEWKGYVRYTAPIFPTRNYEHNQDSTLNGGYLVLQIFIPKEGDTDPSDMDNEWWTHNFKGLSIQNLAVHLLKRDESSDTYEYQQFETLESKDSYYEVQTDIPYKDELSLNTNVGTDLKLNCFGALHFKKKYFDFSDGDDKYYDTDGWPSGFAKVERWVRAKYFDRGHNGGYLEDLLLNTYLSNLEKSRYQFTLKLRYRFQPFRLFEFELLKRDGDNSIFAVISQTYDCIRDETELELEEIVQENKDELHVD